MYLGFTHITSSSSPPNQTHLLPIYHYLHSSSTLASHRLIASSALPCLAPPLSLCATDTTIHHLRLQPRFLLSGIHGPHHHYPLFGYNKPGSYPHQHLSVAFGFTCHSRAVGITTVLLFRVSIVYYLLVSVYLGSLTYLSLA